MKKRILILVLAIVCLFSFASCKKETPYSLYTAANEAMTAANGVDAKVTIDLEITGGDEAMEQKIEMDMKANGENLSMVTKVDMDGETMENTILYVDGVMYMDMGELGGKMKMEVSADEFAEDYDTGEVALPELTEELLKDVKIEKDGDNKFFTIALAGEDSKKYFADSVLGSLFGDDDEIKVEKFDVTLTFDKSGKLIKMAMDLEIVPTEEATDADGMAAKATVVYEFKDITTAPTIEAPADADEYLDMSDLMG
ncbi:MAG: hypothetical protein E7666_00715 [Ruminococcaceae bacterium]|nr:hypothetical protein [Oscillospiraceae bacterium]